jgi:putative ABC transport system permease protein
LVQTPEVLKRENRGQWVVVARLAEGATARSAQAEMETIGRRLGLAYPPSNQGRNLLPLVQTFRKFFIFENEIPVYWTMWGAVGFVLLIVCANLANLMLARAIGRARGAGASSANASSRVSCYPAWAALWAGGSRRGV